jgi:hypothetical protein
MKLAAAAAVVEQGVEETLSYINYPRRVIRAIR